MKERDNTIDVAKGIAIMLVVLGHSLGETSSPLNKIILSFHMPLFFFLSGFLWKFKSESYWSILKKKVITLFVPQMTLGVIYSLYSIVITYGLLHAIKFNDIDFIDNIFRWWFLIVLFWVVVIWEIIMKILKKGGMIFTILISLFYVLVIGDNYNLPLYLHVVPQGMLFYAFGYWIKTIKLKDKEYFDLKGWYLISVPILVIIALINTPVVMYENEYGNILMFYVSSIVGIYLILISSEVNKGNRILKYCGFNSIIIYVVHFCIVQSVRGVVIRLPWNINESLSGWIVFIGTILMLIPIVWVCNKYFAVFFGKMKKSRDRIYENRTSIETVE